MKVQNWSALRVGVQISDIVTEKDYQITVRPEFSNFKEITPNVYLTSIAGVTFENLEKHHIRCIFDFAKEIDYSLNNPISVVGIEHRKYCVEDMKDADISSLLESTADEISSFVYRGRNVVVHCFSGVSRSVTVLIAYLMKYYRLTLKQAFDLIATKREIVRPNNGFFAQLIKLEMNLLGKSSVEMVVKEIRGNRIEIPDFFANDEQLIEKEFREW